MPACTFKTIHQRYGVNCLLFEGLICGSQGHFSSEGQPFLAGGANNSISLSQILSTKKGLFGVLPQLFVVQHPCSILPTVSLSAVLVFSHYVK